MWISVVKCQLHIKNQAKDGKYNHWLVQACAPAFEEIKDNLTLGFFIPNKSLELRLHYHFVTLRSGIPWTHNPISLLTINHGLSYWFILSVLVLTRCTTTQPTHWYQSPGVWLGPVMTQYYCAALSLCIFPLSWASYFAVNFLDCCCTQIKQQFVSCSELLSPTIVIST